MHTDQPQIAVDPNLAAEQDQAQKTLITNLQAQAGADTANLMSRFGTRLALGSNPATSGPPTSATSVVRGA